MRFDSSIRLFDSARRLMPGGVSSPVRAISPHPFYTARADGPYLWDCDGNRFIDYCLAYGPMILGHRHPAIRDAVADQMDRGWLYGTPSELEVNLAGRISGHYPSMERLRFVSSGTEATMAAIRVARGSSGKDMIIKIEGGFHGAHDSVLVKAGSGATTLGIPDSQGVPADAVRNTLQVPYNDPAALEEVMEQFCGQIACLIMEPVLGNIGPILPEKGYLQEVRRLTEKNDILLIFDEVITGFRLSLGGAQELFGIKPDLTTLGKIIGGGFPIGVFGGRADLMDRVAPGGAIYQAGTFNGSPASLAAGLATLDVMEKENTLHKLNRMGAEMRSALKEIVEDLGLDYSVVGIASMFKIFFGPEPHDYAQALKCDRAGYLQLFRRMLNSGVFLTPSQYETDFISAAHTQDVIETTLEAFRSCLKS
ncbi:MAG TPA: glutamate-1-semialdehyde 2,1-aminomutase [Methanothrix sp.]|mgnify:CR=1 FL=1|jgi:glutamate-1-semialdehyde 2,1-aminomutase|uniref:glutamate-1-semialdehyde 2,1-aminomutase n=1 Tax=Methanothrix sp. TaxID=90426 RepID=UPI002C385F65|nr:glutamate-1-semialdehyde 2,1-aminomutase [Methanothrix sp.]MDI9418341.1 glutamate-1-semialdehyde 2,1-aminomutase [Euryarchaeota archaeon]HON35101.1 glutamate-1-semialdehyde 2,1-aminomutase [Methanothrix sp.]HRU74723.1 glutamate-1-semialdehyde 2,1-aminomutase [Methanothrix sp.]